MQPFSCVVIFFFKPYIYLSMYLSDRSFLAHPARLDSVPELHHQLVTELRTRQLWRCLALAPTSLLHTSLQANEGGDRKVRGMVSSLLIHVSCNYRRVPRGSSVLPNVISGSLARWGIFPKVSGWIAQLYHSLGSDKGLHVNVVCHTTSPAPGGGGFQIKSKFYKSAMKIRPDMIIQTGSIAGCRRNDDSVKASSTNKYNGDLFERRGGCY